MPKHMNAEIIIVLNGIHWGIARPEAVERFIEQLPKDGTFDNIIKQCQDYVDSRNPLVGIA